ncbi:MAG: tetratricopeptide repeat protein [Hyphomicrobium sp.]|uniref:tetratricopeptide repeat protein n=1 Tax=Hyphomicrobium sp. TaxID=82 RepID=UPI003D0B927F
MDRLARRLMVALAALMVACVASSGASSNTIAECFSDNNERRIAGCSALIDNPALDAGTKSLAYAMRALAYALKGALPRAVGDYDMAIRLDPTSSMALNNRAWVLFKLNRLSEGMTDVERSLSLAPSSPHAHDTRAHIRQALGERQAAMRDYEQAMHFGGEHLVKLYQCGLEAAGVYNGPIDGLYTSDLRRAFETCVGQPSCDPLPADEECRAATS